MDLRDCRFEAPKGGPERKAVSSMIERTQKTYLLRNIMVLSYKNEQHEVSVRTSRTETSRGVIWGRMIYKKNIKK
jgi:hypothetical protein